MATELETRVATRQRWFDLPGKILSRFSRGATKEESDVESDEIINPFQTFNTLKLKSEIMRYMIDHDQVEQRPIGRVRWLVRHWFYDLVSDGGVEGLEFLEDAITKAKAENKRLIFTPSHLADADHPTAIYLMAKAGLKIQDDFVWMGGVNMLRRPNIKRFMRSEHVIYSATPRDLSHARALLDKKDEYGFDQQQVADLEMIINIFNEMNRKARERILESCVKMGKPLVAYIEGGRSYDGFLKDPPAEFAWYFPHDGSAQVIPYRVYGSREINPPGKDPKRIFRKELFMPWLRQTVRMVIGQSYSSSEVWDVWKTRREEARKKADGKKIEINPNDWPMANLANIDQTFVRPERLPANVELMRRFAPRRSRFVLDDEKAA